MMPAHIPAHPQTFAGFGPIDWALLLVVAFSAITAFMRGLIRSVVSLVGVVLGIVLAAWYTPALGMWLVRWVHGIPAGRQRGFHEHSGGDVRSGQPAWACAAQCVTGGGAGIF